MMRRFFSCLLVIASGCAVDAPSAPAPEPSPPPDLSASVFISWGGQDVTSSDPEDSRVPRALVGPIKPCPNVVDDDVVQVQIQIIIGTGSAYLTDANLDCALGHTTIPVPAGSGTFSLEVVTALGYSWLASDTPITTVRSQTADVTSNLNNEIPTSGGGDDGGDSDDGW